MSDTILLGYDREGDPVEIPTSDLLTHGVIVGRTGSGKTGSTVTMIEEAVMNGASAIVIDPKGDLTNLALAFPSLTAEEFAPWVENGKNPTEEAARARAALGESAPNVALWKNAADVTIYAPGKTQGGGRSVNLLPSFDPPAGDYTPQGLRDRAGGIVTAILGAIGYDGDPLTDPANVYLTDILTATWKKGKSLGLDQWTTVLSEPPAEFKKFDGLTIDEFFPKKDRMKVARALVGFRRQATKWLDGEPLNVEKLVGTSKPKVSVFTLRHLDESERQFFCSMLFDAIVGYMFKTTASDRLKLLVVIDEAKGYLPPVQNPPTKKPILTLLAQGRAQGIGLLIGTQNPNDIDYKALTNVGTWLLGNLRERDCVRDLEAVLEARGVETSALLTIPQRNFLVLKKDGTTTATKTRWAYSYLRGPMNGDDLLKFGDNTNVQAIVRLVTPPTQFTETRNAAKATYVKDTVGINFVLTDPNYRPAVVSVQFSADNGNVWRTATIINNQTALNTSPAGVQHQLVWDSSMNIGCERHTVLVRTVVNGRPSESAAFDVDNRNVVRRSLISRIFG